jgi:hypothetical protein
VSGDPTHPDLAEKVAPLASMMLLGLPGPMATVSAHNPSLPLPSLKSRRFDSPASNFSSNDTTTTERAALLAGYDCGNPNINHD